MDGWEYAELLNEVLTARGLDWARPLYGWRLVEQIGDEIVLVPSMEAEHGLVPYWLDVLPQPAHVTCDRVLRDQCALVTDEEVVARRRAVRDAFEIASGMARQMLDLHRIPLILRGSLETRVWSSLSAVIPVIPGFCRAILWAPGRARHLYCDMQLSTMVYTASMCPRTWAILHHCARWTSELPDDFAIDHGWLGEGRPSNDFFLQSFFANNRMPPLMAVFVLLAVDQDGFRHWRAGRAAPALQESFQEAVCRFCPGAEVSLERTTDCMCRLWGARSQSGKQRLRPVDPVSREPRQRPVESFEEVIKQTLAWRKDEPRDFYVVFRVRARVH